MRTRVENVLQFMPWLVCDRGGEIIGYAYADRFRSRAAYQWSASVSVYVDSRAHRGGGGSVGFHRSFDFRQIGLEESVGYKLGAWHHVSMWHLLLRPYTADPQASRTVAEAAASDAWDSLVCAGLPFIRAPHR